MRSDVPKVCGNFLAVKIWLFAKVRRSELTSRDIPSLKRDKKVDSKHVVRVDKLN